MSINQLPPPVVYLERPSKGMAVAAFVLGIVGAVIGLVPLFGIFAIICGVLAIVFGVVGDRKARRNKTGRGLAISGFILGLIAVTLGVIGLVIVDKAFNDLERDLNELQIEN